MKRKKNKLRSLKTNISNSLDLPDELLLDIPLITITGRSKMIIENFKNINHYSNDCVKINTSCGLFEIEGKNLTLKELCKSKIAIKGVFINFRFTM